VEKPMQIQGYDLEPGMLLMGCIYLVHHREDLYPDSHTFRPSRFIERNYSPILPVFLILQFLSLPILDTPVDLGVSGDKPRTKAQNLMYRFILFNPPLSQELCLDVRVREKLGKRSATESLYPWGQ
jgi:hypothetical protein